MSTSSKLIYLSSGKNSSGDYFVEANGAQMANSYVQLNTPHVHHLISSSSTSTSHPSLSYSTVNSALSAQKAAMKLIAASNRLVECSESQPPLKKPFHLYHVQPSMSSSMNNLANIETEKGRVE